MCCKLQRERAVFRSVHLMVDSVEKAREEIVFALKRPTYDRSTRDERLLEAKQPPRRPVPVENRDLEDAIDDMIERFPKTLEYLAK